MVNIEELKKGDAIEFISKSDKSNIINAKVNRVSLAEGIVYFDNTDYPNVGECSMTSYSVSIGWHIRRSV